MNWIVFLIVVIAWSLSADVSLALFPRRRGGREGRDRSQQEADEQDPQQPAQKEKSYPASVNPNDFDRSAEVVESEDEWIADWEAKEQSFAAADNDDVVELEGYAEEEAQLRQLEEISISDIQKFFREWRRDLAIMLYSPSCVYCKQLAPGWLYVRSLLQGPSLVVGKFNCENSTISARLCAELGVYRYPSLYYFGYGDFRQSIPGMMLRRPNAVHVARFEGDFYLSAVYDWVWLMQKISFADRMWDKVRRLWGAPSLREGDDERTGSKNDEKLETYLSNLEERLEVAETELDRYRMLELFDSIPYEGDVFSSQLHDLRPSQENLPLRMCVSDMASEYCRQDLSDQFCKEMLPACSKNLFESEACRPATCPLTPRGCRVVSSCLRPDVIAEYAAQPRPDNAHPAH